VVLYAHLAADAVRSGIPETPTWVEAGGGRLLTVGQVADWCGRADVTGVVVKHVIDLNENITCTGYQPSPRLIELVRLRDRTCVFPHCQRPARACDLDHVISYDEGGSTSSDNLACLCRLHHRLKTHGGWTYHMTRPGVFLWRSPRGHRWRRDRSGTTDLTPPTADPPGQPPGEPPGEPPGQPPDQ
jgi:5-methylcytosine-specific restriction endonuclease McrA